MDKPTLMTKIRRARIAFGVGGVRRAGARRQRTRARRWRLASLLEMMWDDEYRRRDATRASSTTVCTPTSSATAPSRWSRASAAGSPAPGELRRIADVAEPATGARWSRSPAASGSTCWVSARRTCPAIWAELDMPSGFAYSKAIRTVKTCVGRPLRAAGRPRCQRPTSRRRPTSARPPTDEGFWAEAGRPPTRVGDPRWDRVLDWDDPPFAKWFVGGKPQRGIQLRRPPRRGRQGRQGRLPLRRRAGRRRPARAITYAELKDLDLPGRQRAHRPRRRHPATGSRSTCR